MTDAAHVHVRPAQHGVERRSESLSELGLSDQRAAYARLALKLGREGVITQAEAGTHERRARVATDPAGACLRLAAQHGVQVA